MEGEESLVGGGVTSTSGGGGVTSTSASGGEKGGVSVEGSHYIACTSGVYITSITYGSGGDGVSVSGASNFICSHGSRVVFGTCDSTYSCAHGTTSSRSIKCTFSQYDFLKCNQWNLKIKILIV